MIAAEFQHIGVAAGHGHFLIIAIRQNTGRLQLAGCGHLQIRGNVGGSHRRLFVHKVPQQGGILLQSLVDLGGLIHIIGCYRNNEFSNGSVPVLHSAFSSCLLNHVVIQAVEPGRGDQREGKRIATERRAVKRSGVGSIRICLHRQRIRVSGRPLNAYIAVGIQPCGKDQVFVYLAVYGDRVPPALVLGHCGGIGVLAPDLLPGDGVHRTGEIVFEIVICPADVNCH